MSSAQAPRSGLQRKRDGDIVAFAHQRRAGCHTRPASPITIFNQAGDNLAEAAFHTRTQMHDGDACDLDILCPGTAAKK